MQRNSQGNHLDAAAIAAAPSEPLRRQRGRLGSALSALREKVSVALPGESGGRGSRRAQASSARTSRERLREIIERDRALIAAEPEPCDASADAAEPPVERHAIADFARPEDGADDFGRAEPTAEDELDRLLATVHRPAAAVSPSVVAEIESWILEQIADLPAPSSTPLLLTSERDGVRDPQHETAASAREERDLIRTRTMARLLASQGYLARSLSIYDELIERDGEDAALQAEADAVRAKAEAVRRGA